MHKWVLVILKAKPTLRNDNVEFKYPHDYTGLSMKRPFLLSHRLLGGGFECSNHRCSKLNFPETNCVRIMLYTSICKNEITIKNEIVKHAWRVRSNKILIIFEHFRIEHLDSSTFFSLDYLLRSFSYILWQ